MVGPLLRGIELLKRKKKGEKVRTAEPIKKGALYYHRGHGWYSKYSPARDRKHKERKGSRKRKRVKQFIPGEVGKGRYRHTHDRTTLKSEQKQRARAVLAKVRKKLRRRRKRR